MQVECPECERPVRSLTIAEKEELFGRPMDPVVFRNPAFFCDCGCWSVAGEDAARYMDALRAKAQGGDHADQT